MYIYIIALFETKRHLGLLAAAAAPHMIVPPKLPEDLERERVRERERERARESERERERERGRERVVEREREPVVTSSKSGEGMSRSGGEGARGKRRDAPRPPGMQVLLID